MRACWHNLLLWWHCHVILVSSKPKGIGDKWRIRDYIGFELSEETDFLSMPCSEEFINGPQKKAFYEFDYRGDFFLPRPSLFYQNTKHRSLHDTNRVAFSHTASSQAQPLSRVVWLNVAKESHICCVIQEKGFSFLPFPFNQWYATKSHLS